VSSEAEAVELAIAKLGERFVFRNGDRRVEIRSLIAVSSWRPVKEDWWTKKEACVVGEDQLGNPILRVCDGTVRLWDREKREDEVLASSVRDFLSGLREPGDS
jgi:hypothetical protein